MNIMSVIQTSRMIASGEHIQKEGFKVTIVDAPVASFSFLGHIVISREDFTATPVILTHEMSHVRKHHSVDVLLFSVVTVLHWFNPLVWLARAELKMLHEYEADESVIGQGVNAADYQLLLVRKRCRRASFPACERFQPHKTFKSNRYDDVRKKLMDGSGLRMSSAYHFLFAHCASAVSQNRIQPDRCPMRQ